MKDEAISSSGDHHFLPPRSSSPALAPAASSVGASSPAVPVNGESGNFGQGQNSKGGSTSRIESQPTCASLSTSAGGSALGTSQPSCRPWERGDLLRRLSTFKPVNWFQKPKAASSLACARRGWVNVGADKIECESCGATLKYVLPATSVPSEVDAAGEIFSRRLDEEHKASCPWIGNCCSESLVQFPPTPPSALIAGYRDRCDGLLQFPCLPVVAASAIEHIRVSRGSEIDRLLQSQITGGESGIKLEILLATDSSRDDIFFLYSRAQKLISLCGWEPRWLPNVQDCEEHSVQSARNGHSAAPSKRGPPRDPSRGKKPLSSSTKKDYDNNVIMKSKAISRSPLLDCSLCGATVRIWDFLTVSRPSSFAPLDNDVPETRKKIVQTRGLSAASGVSGWVAANDAEKELVEEREEDATGEGKSLSNIGVDLNLTLSAGLSSSQLHMNVIAEQDQNLRRGRDLMIGQPSSSEVGNRAASYESRGPSSRKRNLDEGGSTVDRAPSVVQQADSVEGSVIDRDGDEVDGGGQYSAGPSKRARGFGVSEARHSLVGLDQYAAGPSHSFAFYMGNDTYMDEFDRGPEQVIGQNPPTMDSTRVSSVIAIDTVHNAGGDSMESVENYPGDLEDIHMPSTSGVKNSDFNEASELNYSAQAQQSACPATVRSTGEMGVSSTNEEEVVNADTNTAQGKDAASFGISGGSIGMGASHEAEIHGPDAFICRTGSTLGGDVELVAEVTDNQGQTGEFALDPGLTGDFVPEEMDREDRQGDNQDLISRSMARADSSLKIVDSTKAESVESGEKTSNMRAVTRENSPHPSLSCNAVVFSGFDASKDEITQAPKNVNADDYGYAESGYNVATGIGPPNGASNYDEVAEFDPIKHHNPFCSWVNPNVAAAGCSSSSGSSSSAGILALCGWQLTLDALDTLQTLGHVAVQTVESESAASMYKDDTVAAPGKKLLSHHSFSKSRGKN